MHFLQSKTWRECKKNLGNGIYDVDTNFFHTTKLPYVKNNIGYMPRINLRTIEWKELISKGLESQSIYITIDPINLKNEIQDSIEYVNKKIQKINPQIRVMQGKPVHLQLNTIINLSKDPSEILSNMKQKHRYNLKLAAKKGVEVEIGDSEEMFQEFLELYEQTVDRKEYNARSSEYIFTVMKTIKEMAEKETDVKIATAYFEGKPLASWILFLQGDKIYYPYGGSSSENKSVMAPYALVWGIIEWGKSKGFKWFDMWGVKYSSQGTSEDFEGYSRFKVGFGGDIIEYADSVDIVFQPVMYKLLKLANLLKNLALKIRKR